MRYSKGTLAVFLASLLASGVSAAQAVNLKMASQAPEASPIGAGLNKLAAEWSRLSGGAVKLKIYHGSSLGDEESFRQKMNTGLLDAAVFTSQGVSAVVPEFLSFSAPSLFANQDEFNYALDKLGPELKKKLEDHGLIAIGIAPSGWIRIFSRTPIASPDELRRIKLGINPYDNSLIQFFKLMNMNVVPTQGSLMLQKMQAKAVDAFYTSPVYFSYQWSSYSNIITSMTDVKLCPFMGCLVMRKQSWEKIPEATRPVLLAATAKVAKEIEAEMISKEDSIIRDLGSHGLLVAKPTPAQAEEWQKTFAAGLSTNDSLKLFPPEMIGKIRLVVAEYRAGKR